jgi:hypothetical protein
VTPFEGQDSSDDVPDRSECDDRSFADDDSEDVDGIYDDTPYGTSWDLDDGLPENRFLPDQEMEAAERPEYGTLVNAALGSMHDHERESLKKKIASFVALHPEHTEQLDTRNWDRLDDDTKGAASAIWNQAAAMVGRAVTEQHLREYREDLLDWWHDPDRETASEEYARMQHPCLARVWDAMKELTRHLLEEAVQAAVIEMLFPGAHLIIPPTNLVAALFTAGDLEDLADGIA